MATDHPYRIKCNVLKDVKTDAKEDAHNVIVGQRYDCLVEGVRAAPDAINRSEHGYIAQKPDRDRTNSQDRV
jgi:hypothetical protein